MLTCAHSNDASHSSGRTLVDAINASADKKLITSLHTRLESTPSSIEAWSLDSTNPNELDELVQKEELGCSTRTEGSEEIWPEPSFANKRAEALYSFTALDDSEVSFEAGDIFTDVNKIVAFEGQRFTSKRTGADPDWFVGKHEKTGTVGRIPANYIAHPGSAAYGRTADDVFVGGINPSMKTCNGVYRKTDQMQNEKPVYKMEGASNDFYIRFSTVGAWQICGKSNIDANNLACWVQSVPIEASEVPSFATGGKNCKPGKVSVTHQAREADIPPVIRDVWIATVDLENTNGISYKKGDVFLYMGERNKAWRTLTHVRSGKRGAVLLKNVELQQPNDTLKVSNCPSDRSTCNGVYKRTGEVQHERPVYKKVANIDDNEEVTETRYLVATLTRKWIITGELNVNTGFIISVDKGCPGPLQVENWRQFQSGTWVGAPDLEVDNHDVATSGDGMSFGFENDAN